MTSDAARQLMELYPRIYFACHARHVRDPRTRRLLSAHQASILDHLDEREPLTLVDLARHMGVTPSTMSLHVERLVRRGYVSRLRANEDGRRLRLLLTPAGVRVREAKSVLDPDRVRALVARLTPDALADDRHQHINRDCDPDLGLHGVVAGPIKRLDSQVLLDPFEKQFYLPTAFVDLGDLQCRQLEVIGEEFQSAPVLDIQVTDASQRIGIRFRRFEGS